MAGATNQERAESSWAAFESEALGVRLQYPSNDSKGLAIEVAEDPWRGNPRVHLRNPDRSEVYVEVTRFLNITPEEEYTAHRPYLDQRFGPDAVTELTESSIGGLPGWTYAIRWPEGARTVLLVEIAGDTYRVIYNPRSPVNLKVLETISFERARR